MDISMRSMLTAGVAAVTASAVVFAPTIAAPSAARPDVHAAAVTLSAAVQPIVPQPGVMANAAAAAASPAVAAAAAGTLASSGNAIMNFYYTAEPWVQYGFQLATWAVGYIPIAGYFSGLIMVAYYTGEPIVQSFFQSAQYAVDGNWGAIPSTLVDGFVQGGQNFVTQGLNWILGYFPPFPPLPPFPGLVTTAAASTFATATLTSQRPTSIAELVRAALAPVERLVNTTIATLRKDIADTETTIKNAVLAKDVSRSLTATDNTAATVEAAGQPAAAEPTEPTATAPKVAHPRFRDAVKAPLTALAGKAASHPQAATIGGAAKAAPGAATAGTQPRKSGHAAHSGRSAK
jgi:hypothetical protein